VLRGVCAILFGFFAWFWPGLTLLALILTWATLACVNGVTTLVSAFARDGHEPRWILLLEGGVSLLAASRRCSTHASSHRCSSTCWRRGPSCRAWSKWSQPTGCATRSAASSGWASPACCRCCSALMVDRGRRGH
jgi:hypothetical protein